MYNLILVIFMIKLRSAQYFSPLPLDQPYSQQNQSKLYNYGYWFKFQPLLQLSNNLRFGNSSNINKLQSQQLLSFELSDENTLSLWHYQSGSFNHKVTIASSGGIETYQFEQNVLEYEGQWKFFGIQIINDEQYQILFYSNTLQIMLIDGTLNRKLEQDYYIGCFGTFFDGDGSQIYFQQFQGRLTEFIQLPETVTESNFEEIILSTYQSYISMFEIQLQTYFEILTFDGQIVKKYDFMEYREGIRYGISMWVKSNVEQYTLALNYTVLRATLNEFYTDNYLGDKQLLIQYQIGVVPSENIVYVTTYSFQAPIYSLQKKNAKDQIQIQDLDLMKGLRQWNFIQFEYGMTSQPDASPPIYNSLFTLDMPSYGKKINQDWNRDNNHFTGVPIYFYLGGGLSQYENKFIGSISKFKFISFNTENMEFIIECNGQCLTCNGPTSSDCLTCSAEQNRVFSQDQCVCKQGYLVDLYDDDSYCQPISNLYPMIEFLETEYNCPQGYDQCKNGKIVCSLGYFLYEYQCFQCPLQSDHQENLISCLECLFLPIYWDRDKRCTFSMQLINSIFNPIQGDYFYYTPTIIDNILDMQVEYYPDVLDCSDGYGFNDFIYMCDKCLNNCLHCQISDDQTQTCKQCPMNNFLSNNICIRCGMNCKECDQESCLVCQDGSFLTLDKINCNQCSIQNCKYCYQYTDQIYISLDIYFQAIDPLIDESIISCARCEDNYVIDGSNCVQISLLNQFQIESCLTGIIQNNKFQCLIGFNQENSLQLNDCSLIKNCYSCFIRYPIDPWCIECVDGYYVQLQDGSCVPCPDSCASCIQQHSIYKDSWKINIRALYYYQFGSHKFEEFAVDTNLHLYEIICTQCKDGSILYDKSCIPGCTSNCQVCETQEGKAVCVKCKDNKFGALRSVDSNFQCLDCPQHCNACLPRNSDFWSYLNIFFEPTIYYGEQHYCYLFEQNYFLDNEYGLPVNCQKSKKCFRSLKITINIYCDSNFEKKISNCQLLNIKKCLQNIFNQELIDYIKQSVIKEVELVLILKFSKCLIRFVITISQTLKESVYTLNQISLIITTTQQTTIELSNQIVISNFTNCQINNLTIIANGFNRIELYVRSVQLYFIVLKYSNNKFSMNYFSLNDIMELEINNFTVQSSYQVRFYDIIQAKNLLPDSQNTFVTIQNVLINQTQFFGKRFLSFFIENVNLHLNITNFTILNSRFENCFSFFSLGDGVKISSKMRNISLINNNFSNSSFIQWNQTSGQPQLQLILQQNVLINSTLIKIPLLDLIQSNIFQNQLFDSIIFLNNGKYDSEVGFFNFTSLVIKQNNYSYGSQFIRINQLENSNIYVYFDNYISKDNRQNFLNTYLNYELSLIYVNVSNININNFTIERHVGIIELAMVSQQITIHNLRIENSQRNDIIYKDKSCLQQQQNIIIYIFDPQYILIDNFIINQMGSIDFSIIIIQSQSKLKKQQNEQIIIQNGIISNNSLAIRDLSKQISVIEINSDQHQEIYCTNLTFKRNILNLYVQNLQMLSSSTIYIQSDQGQVQFDGCQFKQNFVINSTNSPFYVYCNQIYIFNTNFTNNNIFNIDVYKTFIILSYQELVSIEQIQFKDFPIQSNGGSGNLQAQHIQISNIIIQGSYGLNGASFYIQTVGISIINITQAVIKSSYTTDDQSSKGGVFFIDGSKSNLQINLENVQVSNTKSRQAGGFMFIRSSRLTIKLRDVNCNNCFSLNGGFIYLDSTNQIDCYVQLNNISIQNPNFRWFFQDIFNITSNEQIMLSKYSYLIYLSDTILQVSGLKVTDGNLFGILYYEGNQGLLLQGLFISNYLSFQTPLITVTHPQMTETLLIIKDIQIFNISRQQMQQIDCNPSTMNFDSDIQCQGEQQQQFQTFSYFTEQILDNNFNCNYQNIYQISEFSFALIEFYNFTQNKLLINNVQIYNSTLNKLDFGLLSIRDFTGIRTQIKINDLQMINNSCGNYGCLLTTSLSQNIQNQRLLQTNFYEILNLQTQSVIIDNSKLINNQAIYGSGMYIQNVSVMILNTVFIHNRASKLGGAIYFNGNINSLVLLNNQIINNLALNQSGSGIYLYGITLPKLDRLQNIFFDNQQDFNEIPQKLQMMFNNIPLNKFIIKNDSQTLIEQVNIRPYKILGQKQLTDFITLPTGQQIKEYQYFDQFNQEYISYNISLRFIPLNRFQQHLFDQQIDLQLSARIKNESFGKKYFNKNTFTFDATTQSFNLDDLIIYFSPFEPTNLEVKVDSPDIKIPIYSTQPPYNIESYKNYELRFVIKTFKCQLGQFFNVNTQSCEQCLGNTYSVQINSTICVFKDDNYINEVDSAMIQLKPGYWRAYVFSPQVDSCYHLEENCIGGWGTGNQLCSQGHIGALCEQCDLYNIRGDGSYSVSQLYSCGLCSESKGNILSVILISLWTMISIVMTVQSTIDLVRNQIQKMQQIQISLNYSDQKPNPAVLIKVISNYLQIIITITTFQLKVPPYLSTIFLSAGNPISSIAYSLDCFLIDITVINIIYFRIIWGIYLAFSYILIYQIGYFMLVFTKKTIFNISAVTTCFIYLYVYLQPNLISSLIELVSFRYISDQQWIAGNVSYRFDTRTHASWLIFFVVPLMIIIGIIIPILLFFGLYKNRKNLNLPRNKQVWEYLYNEYKLKQYYWETIKIFEKQFIIIVLAYYEDFIPIKAALVFICLFLYSQATQLFQPYNQGMFNKIDTQSTTVCAVSIILATTIYTAQENQLNEIIWPFYIIISTLNTLFLIKLLWFLFYAYGQKLERQLDSLRDKILLKFPNSIYRFPFLRTILENQQDKKQRIYKRFKKIKSFLIPQAKYIIEIKNSRMNMFSSKSNQKELRETSYIHYKEIITSPKNQDKQLFQEEFLNKNQTD